MMHFIVQFSQAPHYFLSLSSKYSPQHPFSSILNGVREQISHPHKTTAKIILFIYLKKTDYGGN
jgi:hypothetical protein